ncbi:MAG TPA: GAF domain-containing protein, partial [Anaerolineales bacterium]|nr:GAF domain-containing protein [Anaerolineales bacterium]
MKRASPAANPSDKDTVWAAVLQATAAVARGSGSSEADVLRALTSELRRLRMSGAILFALPDDRLQVQSVALSRGLISQIERLGARSISGYDFPLGQVRFYGEAMRTRQTLFLASDREVLADFLRPTMSPLLPRLIHWLGDNPTIAAPMLVEEEAVGLLVVTASWLGTDDVPVVTALADHTATAIANVRGRLQMQRALDRERMRNQVAEALASARDLSELIHRVVGLAIQMTEADAGGVLLVDAEGNLTSAPYLVGLPEDPRFTPEPGGLGVIWRVIQSRQPLILENYRADPQAIPAFVAAGIHSYLAVPLIHADEVIGAMGLFGRRPGMSFRQDQIELAESIARLAAIAVKNVRLFAEVASRAEESQALIRTARSVTASLDLVTVLSLIAAQARELLRADGSRIHLLDPERNVLKVVVANDTYPDELASLELEPGIGLAGWVMQNGEPLLTNDPTSDPRAVVVPGTPPDEPECLLMAPLTVRQRTAGVMVVVRQGSQQPFLPKDLDLLAAFAAQAAVAIENAHLFGQIQSQASRLEAEVAERTRDLALSEARYRALVELSIAGIQQLDPQGRIVYANRALAEMLETTPEELTGKTLADLAPPGVTPHPLATLQERLGGERPTREVVEILYPTRSGRQVPVLLGTSLIRDDRGEPQGSTVLMLDISARKALEAALRQERDRIGAILENIGDAVFVTDAHGVIEYVNPAWERLNGFSAAEAVGQSASLLNSHTHAGEVFDDLWRTVLGGHTWRGELVNKRKDGSTYDAALTATPLSDEAHTITNIVSVLYDISAMKELERLKSQFVSDVSHELRTPLTNIRLYLDLLRGTTDRTKTERYLDTLSRESDRLAYLIDDLLSLSRLDSGAVTPDMRAVDVNRLLGSLVDDRRALATQRGLELTLEWDPSLPPARGDERLLSQVFTNLLTNAMNYTP